MEPFVFVLTLTSNAMAGNICTKSGGFHEPIDQEELEIAKNELRIYADCNNCDKKLICVIPFRNLTISATSKDYDMRLMTKEELLEEIMNMELHFQKYGFGWGETSDWLWETSYKDFIEKKEDVTITDMMIQLDYCRNHPFLFLDKTSISDEEIELADKCSHIPSHGDFDHEDESFSSRCKNCEYIIRSSWSCEESDFFDVLDQAHN